MSSLLHFSFEQQTCVYVCVCVSVGTWPRPMPQCTGVWPRVCVASLPLARCVLMSRLSSVLEATGAGCYSVCTQKLRSYEPTLAEREVKHSDKLSVFESAIVALREVADLPLLRGPLASALGRTDLSKAMRKRLVRPLARGRGQCQPSGPT